MKFNGFGRCKPYPIAVKNVFTFQLMRPHLAQYAYPQWRQYRPHCQSCRSQPGGPGISSPGGKSLIAAIVIEPYGENDEALKNRVKNQLLDWFGSRANAWRHLKTYHIKRVVLPVSADA
ncbi:MAG: hypothetical protein R2860_12915 [Desulfobacterales bacterium]